MFKSSIKDIICGHVKKVCNALHYRLDNILIRFGLKVYRQILVTNLVFVFLL